MLAPNTGGGRPDDQDGDSRLREHLFIACSLLIIFLAGVRTGYTQALKQVEQHIRGTK